jgi:hypothetical protein
MRLALLIAFSLTLLSVVSAAQTDKIGLFVDTNYEECNLVDSNPGMVTVYVVHSSANGATASQFRIESGSGVSLSYMAETSPFSIVVGNTQTGVSIAYGNCKYSDILVSTVSYYSAGGSSACSNIWVSPDPGALTGTIEVVNCSTSKLQATGSRLVINPNGSCACGPTSVDTNWGKIKDIYD